MYLAQENCLLLIGNNSNYLKKHPKHLVMSRSLQSRRDLLTIKKAPFFTFERLRKTAAAVTYKTSILYARNYISTAVVIISSEKTCLVTNIETLI